MSEKMNLFKLSYYGLSGFACLSAFLCGVAGGLILRSQLPFSIKAFSACLLLLVSIMVFAFDNEMAFLESMQK